MGRWSVRLILTVLALGLVACGKGSKKSGGGGGVDGGGGQFAKPSREEALKEVNTAWELLSSSKPDNPIVVVYLYLMEQQEKKKLNPEGREILIMIEKILGAVPGQNLLADSTPNMQKLETIKLDLPELELTKYLRPKKLSFREDGLCTGPAHEPAMASVTKLSRDGEMCVSIFGIRQQPAATLKSDILGLLVHEIAHLNGYDETAAKALQKYFINSAGLALRMKGRYHLERYMNLMLQQLIERIGLIMMRPPDEALADDLIKSVQTFGFLLPVPYWGDDVRIDKPERYTEVSNLFVNFGQSYVEHLRGYNSPPRPKTDGVTLAMRSQFVRDALAIISAVRDYLLSEEFMSAEMSKTFDLVLSTVNIVQSFSKPPAKQPDSSPQPPKVQP